MHDNDNASHVVERKQKRRLLRVSLRAFFVLITLFAIWLGFSVSRANKQRNAVAALSMFDVTIHYEHQLDLATMEVDSDAEPPGPKWLRGLVGEDFFSSVNGIFIASRSDRPVTDDSIKKLMPHFQSLPELRKLDFFYADGVTDISLTEISKLKKLEYLCIASSSITSGGVSQLASLTHLKRLTLGESLDDNGMQHLQRLPNLEEFGCIGRSQVTDDGLAFLKYYPALRNLSLQDNRLITDAGVKHIRNASRLDTLMLYGQNFTNDSLKHLAGHPKLEKLLISDTRVTDSGLRHLSDLPKLNYLRMNRNKITDAGMVHLARIQQIEWLGLSNTQITDEGLNRLAALKNLYWLDFRRTKVTPQGAATIKKLLPNCHFGYP